MKRDLLIAALLLLVFCLITPSVSAAAEINRDVQKTSETETVTETWDLDPEYAPYTEVNVTRTLSYTISLMYNQVWDAKGNIHLNGKALVVGIERFEAWLWNSEEQVWVFGQRSSQSQRQIVVFNEVVYGDEVQTRRELYLSVQRSRMRGFNPLEGETFNLKYGAIDYWIIKLVNGELQFERRWEIVKAPSS